MERVLPNDSDEPTAFGLDGLALTEEDFERLAAKHSDLFLELSAEGGLEVVSHSSLEIGAMGANIIYQLATWSRDRNLGISFSGRSLFTFPNGAKRSPNIAWARTEKWEALSAKERKGIARLVPDLVIEILPNADSGKPLKEKMVEYNSNGVRLGWLIEPEKRRVHVYRTDSSVEILDDPTFLYGGEVLPGFELNIREIW